MSEAKVPSAVCENDECDVYRSLPEVTHRIFGVTSPSYHDLAHLYAAQAAEIARLVTALKWCMAKMDRGDGVLEYTGDEADVAFEATLQDLLARAALREEGKP